MINPVTLTDIMIFFNSVLDVFGSYLILTFSLMLTFALMTGIRKIFIGTSQ